MTPTLPPAQELLDLLPEAVCVVDGDGRFLYVSRAFEQILGYACAEVVGLRAFELVHPDDLAMTIEQAARVMEGAVQRHFRNRYRHKRGHWVDIQWSARWHPAFGVRIAIGQEVGELRRTERELEHLAAHDPLTGLANRHKLQRELRMMLEKMKGSGEGFALLYLDLDGFKEVNDRHGHDVGDGVLREVGRRLRLGVRQSDTVARLGGDEFVVLLPGACNREAASRIADSLRNRLRAPFMVPDAEVVLDASVGIACFPDDGDEADTLISHADHAMYAAKRRQAPGGGEIVNGSTPAKA